MMATYNTLQSASCGYGLDTLLDERLRDGSDATACPVVEQGEVQRHDGPFDACRGLGWVALGSCGPFLAPGGMLCIIAISPRGEPTFRAGQLPPEVLDVVFGTRGVDGLLTTVFGGLGHDGCLWELMGYVPRSHVFAMAWHNRWPVPGSLWTLMMDSRCTRHTWRRQSRDTQEQESVSHHT